MQYRLTMRSFDLGREDFGPYDTVQDAFDAQERIRAKAKVLADGIDREFEITCWLDEEEQSE